MPLLVINTTPNSSRCQQSSTLNCSHHSVQSPIARESTFLSVFSDSSHGVRSLAIPYALTQLKRLGCLSLPPFSRLFHSCLRLCTTLSSLQNTPVQDLTSNTLPSPLLNTYRPQIRFDFSLSSRSFLPLRQPSLHRWMPMPYPRSRSSAENRYWSSSLFSSAC